jgi:outer membrane protein OmpA-like peptidoglycan-associated protein
MTTSPKLTVLTTSVAAFVSLTLAACATTSPRNDMLEHARAAVSSAQGNPQVSGESEADLTRAQQALSSGDAMLKAGRPVEEVNHEAYIAERFARAAQKGADLSTSEKAIADANSRRNAVLLAARDQETANANDRAQRSNDLAQNANDRAQSEAAAADAARSSLAARDQETANANDRAQRSNDLAQNANDRAQSEAAAADAARNDARASDQRAALNAQQNEASQRHAQELQSALADLQAKKTDRGLVITLGDVLFATGQAELKPGARRSLDKLSNFMQQYPQRTVRIEGFTDSVGSDVSNQRLSEHRADAVRDALTDAGVARDRIQTRGLGKSSPVADNDTATGRQQNRRVEVIISEGDDRTATRLQ